MLEKIGIDCSEYRRVEETDFSPMNPAKSGFSSREAVDVPTYVEYGAEAMGIVGKDTLLEEGRHLYEVLDLGFWPCKSGGGGTRGDSQGARQPQQQEGGDPISPYREEYFDHKRRESIE